MSIEVCLKTTCENITASIDDGVIKMMANLIRQRIFSITILIENNGIAVQKSHPMKISESAYVGNFVAENFHKFRLFTNVLF